MGKLAAFWNALRKGGEVSNVEGWKNGQVTANTVVAFLAALVAVSKAIGYPLPIDDGSVVAIGGGVFAIVNVIITAASSKRAGILPAKPVPLDLPTVGEPYSAGPQPAGRTSWVDIAERDFPKDPGGGS